MSLHPRWPDVLFGTGAVVVALAWLWGAARIEDSLLADEVGAAGIPRVLGGLMIVVGAIVALRGLGATRSPTRDEGGGARAHLMALGLVGWLLAYLVVAPYAGFALALALLVAGVAWYGGAPLDRTLVVTSALAGVGFWIVFVHLLGIGMPVSVFLEGH